MSEVDALKKRIRELESRMGIGEDDPAKNGYIILVAILKQQNEYLKNFKIKDTITSDDSAKKVEYKNAKDLWEGLTSMIKNVAALRIELKMEDKTAKLESKPISASSIAEEEDEDD